jgi:uncharacterized protein with HEPN domain
VKDETVWNVVVKDIPELRAQVEKMLGDPS